jgi:hypothetical protein
MAQNEAARFAAFELFAARAAAWRISVTDGREQLDEVEAFSLALGLHA